jgi:hypothetical protein
MAEQTMQQRTGLSEPARTGLFERPVVVGLNTVPVASPATTPVIAAALIRTRTRSS